MSERHSISVAVELKNRDPMDHRFLAGGLILVTKRDSRLLGLPAGHVETEDPFTAAIREVEEETGLTKAEISLANHPVNRTIVSPGKVSMGILYPGTTLKCIPQTGYARSEGEIAYVRPYLLDELLELIKTPDMFYKPEFNIAFISLTILNYIATKYAYESPGFQRDIASSWGISQENINSFM